MQQERVDVTIQVPLLSIDLKARAPQAMSVLERMIRASGVSEHNCPFCKQTFETEAFIAHVPDCCRNHVAEELVNGA